MGAPIFAIVIDSTKQPVLSAANLREVTFGDQLECSLLLTGDTRSGAAGYTPIVAIGKPGEPLALAESIVAAAGKWSFLLKLNTVALGGAFGYEPRINLALQVVVIEDATGRAVTSAQHVITVRRGVYTGALVPLPTYSEGIETRLAALEAGGVVGGPGAVSSVQGRTGAVVITKVDLALGNVDNTADSAKPVSTAQAIAISAAENNAKSASRASNWVPTWNEVAGKPLTFSPSAHGHDWSEVTGKPSSFTPASHTHLWADLTDKPATFAPTAHSHAISDTTNLQTTLDAKQAINSELTAILAALTGTGYLRRTGANTYVVDTPSGAVGPDLTAIEALTGTGYAQRTGADTWVLSTPSGGAPAQTDADILAGTSTEQRTINAAQAKLAARSHSGQRGFKAYNSVSAASISIAASTWTKVGAAMLDVEAWDSDGWWNAATARFQPTVAGWYLIAGGALFTSPPDQARYVIGVLYNGINPGQTGNNSPMLARCAQSGTAATGGCGAVMAYFNGSTDYAELCVFQGSGGPTDLLGGVGAIAYNNFSAILIRSDS